MRIGINLLYLIPGVVGGTQTYALGLLKGLARLDTDDEYILYVNRECRNLELPSARNFKRVECPIHSRVRGVRYAWEQFVLPVQARRDRLDVLHSLAYVGPVRAPCAHVLTIHDMNYLDIPQSVPGLRKMALTTLVHRAAARADRVIAVSEFARARIIHHLHLDPDRVTVTHLAAREDTSEDAHKGSNDGVRAQYGITTPYVVAFSSPFPHKNITALIEAFADIAADVPHALVLVGHLPPNGDVTRAIDRANLGSRIIVTGYIPDADILPVIAHADLFAFPSIYEGFGLPVLDAQRLGVPVVASDAASVPEVAGNGALYFNPREPGVISATLTRVLGDPDLAKALRERGKANAARFDWATTASRTHTVYAEVSGSRTRPRSKEA